MKTTSIINPMGVALKHSALALAVAVGLGLTNTQAVPIININLGNASNANALNGTAYMTGGFAQAPASYTGTTWNDYATTPITATALLDSDGNVTTVGITTASTTAGANNMQGPATSAGGDDVKLLKGYVNRVYNSSSGNTSNNRFTISGLDTANTYNIYLASAHNTPVLCSWRIGATGADKFITNTAATRTAETWVAGDDYVAFYKVAPDADGNILVWGRGLAGSSSNSGLTLNGIQVMDATGFLSPENDMLTCTFDALGPAWISGTNVTLYAPTGTEVTALTPTFTLSPGATITPTTAQDFTSPVDYTVHAEDGTPKVYTITVIVGPVPVPISNATTPWEPANPDAGVRPNEIIAAGNTGILIGTTQTHWGSGGFSVPLILNGNTLIIDSGNGNGMNVSGPLSGNGTLIFQVGATNPMHVSGSTGNTYTGTTTISNAYVSLEKSSGDALRGTITLNNAGSRIIWTASNQISDASDVTLSASSAVLNLAGFSDTINDLYLVTGTQVQTGAGGVLKVARLFINGTLQEEVAYIADGVYVTGSGYIEVGASGPPVVNDPPATPATPVPTDGSTTAHPANLAKLDWADSSLATSYDVYFWLASETKPETPTSNVSLSEYTLSSQVLSLSTYMWQIVAKNGVGDTAGPEWTFTTMDRRDISNDLGIAPQGPAAGILIDDTVGIGNTGRLVGTTRSWWGAALVSVDLNLNGNTLQLERGWNTPYTISGAISGDGVVRIEDAPAVTINGSTGNTYTGTTVVYYSVASLAKSAGNALCGDISVSNGGSTLVWTRSDQISDLSNVTLATAGTKLDIAGFSDTIAGLILAAGTSVETGTAGVLMTGSLTVDGTLKDPGTYTVADGFVTGTGSVVVTGSGGNTYGTWAAANAGGQTAGEDFDNDGVANGVEYFMGETGSSFTANPSVATAGAVRTVTWPRDPAAVASFKVQVTDNLTDWTDINPPDASIDESIPTQVTYTLPAGAKQFCRLVVTP